MALIHQRAKSLRSFMKSHGPCPAGKLRKTIPGKVMKEADIKAGKDENGRKVHFIEENTELDDMLSQKAAEKNPKSVSRVIDKIRQEV